MTNTEWNDRMTSAGRRPLQVTHKVSFAAGSLIAAVSLIAGCSSGTAPSKPPLSGAPGASNATAYIGTQAPGLWTMSVDTTQNVFSYQSLAAGSATVSGGMTATNGVLDFGSASGVPLGRAVAQPAGGALLRPGGEATYPVPMVQQSGCVPVTGKLRYVYIDISKSVLAGNQTADPGYGTFVVSTSSDATSWTFEDLHNYALTTQGGSGNASTPAGTDNGRDPSIFTAACSASDTQGAVTAGANPAFLLDPNTNSPSLPTFHFNPGGGFVEDRSTGNSWVGFAMPQAAIKASDVAAGTYSGFVFEATPSAPIDTRTVAFAAPTSGSATLAGALFPNDDLTATPVQDYTITLGAQDTTLNGVFPNAQFTARDLNGYCAQAAGGDSTVSESIDANGNLICTAVGVAVIGQVGGKYVVYFTSRDGTKEPGFDGIGDSHSYIIQFYLYQQ